MNQCVIYKEEVKQMPYLEVSELIPHPRNNEFFDDMTGEKWTEFLQSIKSRGVIEPIVITSDKIIVSGHQRVRACKELGIKYVMCDIHAYDNEDQVLQDLIETNVRQRGDVGGSAKKIGLRIKELERIYGIEHGNNQFSGHEKNSHPQKTQADLAKDMGMDVRTLQNYKLLAEMIPEMEELLLTGIVSQSTVLAVMRNLDDQQQLELIASLDTTKKITKKECEKYIDEIKKLKEASQDRDVLSKKVKELEQEKEILELSVHNLKKLQETSDELIEQYKGEAQEYMDVKSKIIDMGLEPDGDYNLYGAASEIAKLNSRLQNLLQDELAPIKYQPFMFSVKSSDILRKNFMYTLNLVYDWYKSMADFIGEDITDYTQEEIIDIEEVTVSDSLMAS